MTPRDRLENRRQLLKWLAASPLLAVPGLAGLATLGAEALAKAAQSPAGRPQPLPDPILWAPANLQDLITKPEDAINVFDFEPVARKNIPPAHFGYMASGIDDEVTLRANREGFLKFQLRPRRLVDVSKVDMSADILGTRYNTPIVIAPIGGHKAFHAGGEEAVARAAKPGGHLMILSTQSTTSPEEVMKARGAPIWYQLYATNKWEVTKAFVTRAERAGCLAVAVTVDRNGGRNQETLFRLQRTDTRDCAACHDRSTPAANYRTRPMYDGVDLSGLANIQSSAMTWDTIKRIRDTTGSAAAPTSPRRSAWAPPPCASAVPTSGGLARSVSQASRRFWRSCAPSCWPSCSRSARRRSNTWCRPWCGGSESSTEV
jgi:hypothetical protein